MPPSPQSVARIRNRAEAAFLTQYCTIERLIPSAGPFDDGGTWAIVQTGVPCRVVQQEKPASPESSTIAGQETLPEYYILAIPYDQDIQVDYRVVIDQNIFTVIRLEDELTDKVFKQVVITLQGGQGG